MKEVKKLFSKFNTGLKPFVDKVKSILKLINNIFSKNMKKISSTYKKANSKNKYIEPIVTIGTSCFLVLILIFTIKNFTTVEEVNIATNSAEYLYYENKCNEAIEEYKKMQESDEWPIWTAKIADIYSLQGETEKSNTLLREALIIRDKIIKDEGYEKNKDRDIELISSMIFTFTSNKEYGDAISFGEQYINDHVKDKNILNSMFFAYIQTNNEFKAEELLEEYPLDKNSSYDIAKLANMNILINKWDRGIELLKEAWSLDKNELKIYDVLNEMYLFDKDSLINILEDKIKESDEDVYKVFLASAYSNENENIDKAINLIDELDNNNIDNIVTDMIIYRIYDVSNEADIAGLYLDEAVSRSKSIDKESYSTYYLLSLKALNNEKYDEALTYAKRSINSNINNLESFRTLIPNILIGKKDFESIEIYYRIAMSKEPYNYKTIINLADYYINYDSNYEKGREYYDLAINLKKNDGDLYQEIAKLDIKNEKYEDAIENIKEAIKIDEDNQQYYKTLGALYLMEGNNEEGIEMTRKAYSMNEKDVTSLNNAAWYYLMIEKDLLRGFENLKSAYTEMPAELNQEDRNIIIENYTSAKKVYDKYIEDSIEEFDISGLKLIY